MEEFDVVIVGAGLSGIGAGCNIQRRCPGRSFILLEGRADLGGTWDLFRYPGIRSDSDMHTLGYHFKPWLADKAIADGPAILQYVRETAVENRIHEKIRFQHQVKGAAWSSRDARWTVEVCRGDTGERFKLRCSVLLMCAGYYSYKGGHSPTFPGQETFEGPVIHPQAWPDDFDYSNQRVVVVGSGATAVTLVPAMTAKAAHVTMLQRTPTYIVSRPAKDRIANFLRRIFPNTIAYKITRWKNVLLQQIVYSLSRTRPGLLRKNILKSAREEVGPGFDVDTHLTPDYNPWDQRLCLSPDGDFFRAIRRGKASIVTGHIDTFTKGGVKLQSGEEIPADIIITATGLKLAVLGEAEILVDGQPIDFAKTFTYKGLAYSGVPNLFSVFGYVNASWTLRADLIFAYVCRLLNHMDKIGAEQCTPKLRESDRSMAARAFVDNFMPGYMKRAQDVLPKQGDREPWLNPQSYSADKKRLLKEPLDDGVMQFSRPD